MARPKKTGFCANLKTNNSADRLPRLLKDNVFSVTFCCDFVEAANQESIQIRMTVCHFQVTPYDHILIYCAVSKGARSYIRV